MFRRFALATLIAAAVFGLVSGLGSSVSTSSRGPTDGEAEAAGALSSAGDLAPIQGMRPLPDIIDFWQDRVDGNPVDYPSRTELGFAFNAAASEQGDLELYRRAELVFDEALGLNPQYAKARLGLASSLIAQHRFADAVEQVYRAGGPETQSAPNLALLGDAHLGFGDYDLAAVAIERLVDIERSAPTVSRLARLRAEQGRSDEAVELAREALSLSEQLALRPHSAAFYHFQLGHFLFRAGDVEASTDSYRSALALSPSHGGAAEGLAFNLASAGELQAAAEAYSTLVVDSPAADLHGLYADVLRLLGQHEQADVQEQLGRQAAIESFDDSAERRHLVGYYVTRDPHVAVDLARADLAERHDTGAYDALAWALHHNGQHAEAVEMIELALASGTQNPATLYHAAAIHHAASNDGGPAATQTDTETNTQKDTKKDTARYLAQALASNPNFHPTEAADAGTLFQMLGTQ